MLSRFLKTLITFSFLGCFAYGAEEAYVCPLEPNYPQFVSGAIPLDKIRNFKSREECRNNCIKRDKCERSQTTPKLVEVFGFVNETIEQGNIDVVNRKVAITYFSGISIMSSSGVLLFSYDGKKEYREKLLFETFSSSELTKSGINVISNQGSININSYDGSLEIIADENQRGIRFENGKKVKTIEFIFDEKGEKLTRINGQSKNGWISYNDMLVELGVTLKASGTIINISGVNMADETGNISPIDIKLNGGRGEILFETEISKKREVLFGDKKVYFISKGSVDTQGIRKVKYIVEVEDVNNKETKQIYTDNYRISLVQGGAEPYFYCRTRPDITGDLGQNKFSTQSDCDNLCVGKQECFNQAEAEDIKLDKGCRIAESVLYEPITSSEGETFYMGKKLIIECEVTSKEQTGCDEWETKIVEMPNVDSVLATKIPKIKTNEKDFDFSKAVSIFGTMNALESAGRVFSGESNHCEYGTWFDQPNWAELAIKYALAIGGPFVSAGASQISSIQKGFESIGGISMNDAFTLGLKSFTKSLANTTDILTNVVAQAITESVQIAVKAGFELDKQAKKEREKQEQANQNAYISGGISSGNNVSDSEADKIAKNYAMCMTKLGLGYDVLANWFADNEYKNEWGSTAYIDESYKHPILATPQDVYMLKKTCENEAGTTIEEKDKYFYARYKLETTMMGQEQMILLYPLSAQDRIIAGEVICGGINQLAVIRDKYSERFLNPKFAEPTPERLMEEIGVQPKPQKPLPDDGDKEDSGNGEKKEWTDKKITTTALNTLNSFVPFPYNLIGMVAMDMVDMFDWGNTCNDLEFAEERGDKEAIKANKRKGDGLCVKVQTEVVWKVGNEVARERDYFCCYDSYSTKAFALGIVKQLGLKLTKDNCSPITLEHIKQASFSPCKEGQDPQKDKCFPANHFKELQDSYIQGATIGVGGMIEEIINNMFKLENETSK